MIKDQIEWIGQQIYEKLERLGRVGVLFYEVLVAFRLRPFRWKNFFHQLDFIGVKSTFIVVLTGSFTGAVFALQSSYAFRIFGAESMIAPSVILSLTRELAPVLTALMVAARAGSAMTTELGTMRVTEQIDALYTMAVSPVQYLVLPRVMSSVLMMPLLTVLFNFVGALGAYAVAVGIVDVPSGQFMSQTIRLVDLEDLYSGLLKSAVFGLVVSMIACDAGYHAEGGTRGVGIATTQSVVGSAVMILVFDYILTAAMFGS